MFGHGFFGGIGGGFSLFGLIIQAFLFYWLAKFVIGLFFRRTVPLGPDMAMGPVGGSGFQSHGPEIQQITIGPDDYAAFERGLMAIQDAYSREDLEALRRLATPEMVSYFADDLAHNAGQGLVNRLSQVRLVKGDLAQAWREGATDYATVAMRFSLVDLMIERATNRIVSGDPTRPEEVTEVWTFRRDSGGAWMLSAIQQAH
jgi:predicted lipid-binding transport protein (Tim44 family)